MPSSNSQHSPALSTLRESIDLKSASKITKIPYSTLRQWISEGRLPAYKVGGHLVRVYVADLEALFVPIGDGKGVRR
jgi:excisionase family DNA binding protein